MGMVDKIKDRVGRWALGGSPPGQVPAPSPAPVPPAAAPPGQPNNQPGQSPAAVPPGQPSQNQQPGQQQPIEGEKTILSDRIGQFKPGEMTPDLIMHRNYAILATIKHDRTAHEHVIDFLKEFWRIIGPIAFIFFTAGEVYHFLNHYMEAKNAWENALLWGITLLIEIPFCIATYDLSERKKRAMHAQETGQPKPDRDTGGAVSMWVAMAAINVGGQIAFMVLILNLTTDFAAQVPLYFFVVLRVTGVIIGDAYTAFFLLPSQTEIARILRTQKAQDDGLKQLTEAGAERKRITSKMDAELRDIETESQRRRQEADFMSEFHKQNMQSALEDQKMFLEWKRQNALPPPSSNDESRNPNTGDL